MQTDLFIHQVQIEQEPRYTVMSHMPGRNDIPARSDCEAQQARDIMTRLQIVRRTGETFYTVPPLPDSSEAVIEKLHGALMNIVACTESMSAAGQIAREALR